MSVGCNLLALLLSRPNCTVVCRCLSLWRYQLHSEENWHVCSCNTILYHYVELVGAFISIFSKSTQNSAGLKALKYAANRHYLMCKSLPYYLRLLYSSTFIILSHLSKLDLCEGGSFSTAIFESDMQLSLYSCSCFISVTPFKGNVCRKFTHCFVLS